MWLCTKARLSTSGQVRARQQISSRSNQHFDAFETMSVGFGFSVGDFLAGLELVGTVIDALRESGASGRNFRALINELSALETALFQVKRLDLDSKLQIELLALHQAAAQCQQSIDQLWKTIRPYQPHLGSGTGSRITDGWYKVK